MAIAERIAAAVGITPTADNPAPVTTDLARFGLFLNRAARLGLSPSGAERVVREVKAAPDGKLSPASREGLTTAVHNQHNLSWEDVRREVNGLERGANLLPNAVTVHGAVDVPSQAPVTVKPDVSVNPQVAVTVGHTVTEPPNRKQNQ